MQGGQETNLDRFDAPCRVHTYMYIQVHICEQVYARVGHLWITCVLSAFLLCLLQCLQCPTPDSSNGWFSNLMVCDIGSRNATLQWNRDAATSVYVVLYRDIITQTQIRSDSVS